MSDSGAIRFVADMVGASETAGKLQSLGGAFGSFGKQTDTATASMDKAEKQTKSLGASTKEIGLSFSAAAANMVNLAFQYDDLEKRELKVEKAHKAVMDAEITLSTARLRLQELTEKGTATDEEYEKAQLQLQSAQDGLRIKTEQLAITQGDLSQAQTQFALSVLPTVFSSVQAVSTGITALRGITAGLSMTQGATRMSTLLLAPALGGLGAGGTAAGAGMTAAGHGARFLQIAMGPVGWVMIAVGAAFAAVATNAFGIRDAINDLGRAIGEALPFFKPLLEVLGQVGSFLFPETEESTKEMASTFDTEFEGVQTAFADTAGAAESGTNDIIAATDQMGKDAPKGFGELSRAAREAADDVEEEAERVKDAARSMFGSFSSGSTKTVPNPIGDPIVQTDPGFGSFSQADIRMMGGVNYTPPKTIIPNWNYTPPPVHVTVKLNDRVLVEAVATAESKKIGA